MTDTTERAKKLLADATPGPWSISRYDHGGCRAFVQDDRTRSLVFDAYHEGDSELLFAAPTIIRELIEENERLASERDEARAKLEGTLGVMKMNRERAVRCHVCGAAFYDDPTDGNGICECCEAERMSKKRDA